MFLDQYQLTLKERQSLLVNVDRQIQAFQFQQHFVSFVDYVLNPQKISEMITETNLNISADNVFQYLETIGKKNSVTTLKAWKTIYM